MSMALAGALGGLGDWLVQDAMAKRNLALKMLRDANSGNTGRHAGGSARGSAAHGSADGNTSTGPRPDGWDMSNSERVRIKDYFRSDYGNVLGAPQEGAPTLNNLTAEVGRLMKSDRSLNVDEAYSKARELWTATKHDVVKKYAWWNPQGWVGSGTYNKPVTTYGFRNPSPTQAPHRGLGAANTPPVSSPGEAGLPRIATQDQFKTLPSGSKFVAPDGSVRIKP